MALANLNLENGEVFGYYPPSSANVTQFEGTLFSRRGLFAAERAAESEDAILGLAKELGDTLLLETGITSSSFHAQGPGNPLLLRERVIVAEHVVYWWPLGEGTLDDVGKFLAATGGYDNAFVLRTKSSHAAGGIEGVDNFNELVGSGRAISAILVPAYDAETFVMWSAATT